MTGALYAVRIEPHRAGYLLTVDGEPCAVYLHFRDALRYFLEALL